MGNIQIAILTALIAAILVIGVAILARRDRRTDSALAGGTSAEGDPETEAGPVIPYSTEATDNVAAECLKVAFGVGRIDYQIMGEHAEVLTKVGESLQESVHQRDYFPRRPMQLPKLLQAINDTDSTRAELVRLILEDPTLAGTVLRQANSAFYRVSPAPVENLDRAVFLLGTDGLRGLMATAILQPVFRVPRGYFETFADCTWEQAERTANAAEMHARNSGAADPFVTLLLSMLTQLANIVLFRITMDKYREHPNVLPRAEVFIAAIQAHRARMATLIAGTWELADPSMLALQAREDRISPERMSVIGRCVYYAELGGSLALLAARKIYSQDGAEAILKQQGLRDEEVQTLWKAATAFDREP
jgi:HD-like signal output (HDOD) protein